MQILKALYWKLDGKITKEVFCFIWVYLIQILSLCLIMVRLSRFAEHEGNNQIVTHLQQIPTLSYRILVRLLRFDS